MNLEKKYKKVKWLSEEALQIAVKRREVKSKGEISIISDIQIIPLLWMKVKRN